MDKWRHEYKNFLLLFPLLAVKLNCTTLVLLMPTPQMSFHVIYKAPCGLCLRNMAEIQHYLFQTRCDFIFLEMFCLDPYVLVDRPFQPQRPFYYIPDITGGKEDIPLSCVNEIDSTPPPKVAYSKYGDGNKGEIHLCLCRDQTTEYCLSFEMISVSN